MTPRLALAALAGLVLAAPAPGQYPGWKHSGAVTVLTTPDGADLPADAVVENFPLLVRLHRDFFDFAQARPDGADLRFADAAGNPLAFQVEEWDPAAGTASVWVRVPRIVGNARQAVRLFWGNPAAKPESDGKAVFNGSNGFLSVWHMTDPVRDAVGALDSKDVGTAPAAGVVGPARRLAGKQGVFGGDKIPDYPTGAASHTTSAWFRAERPNGNVIGWGNEQGRGKVVVRYHSPPHVRVDGYFSGGTVAGKSTLPRGEWVHVAYTYAKGAARVYVNGVLDGVNETASSPLDVKSPARLWIGGWYHNYDFVGDVDEVRVSRVTRSAAWVRLEYENQKPMPTLVGPVVRPGDTFRGPDPKVEVAEGGRVTLTATADGAQKLYWLVARDGRETVAAVDRLALPFDAGRVGGDQQATVRVRAVYPDRVRTAEVAVTIREAIPEPAFTLRAPAAWDGRQTIEVVPEVTNLAALKAAGADKLNVAWDVAPIATIRETAGGKLTLKRAQNSGPMTVTATIDNGGPPVTRAVTIAVTEPKADPWVARTPDPDEKPEDGQFYARDDSGFGTLHYNGTVAGPADTVFLRVFADDAPFSTADQKPGADGAYRFAVKLKPGLVRYRVEFGTKAGGREAVTHKVGNLVCGDAYLITGQSNAVATDFGKDDPPFRSDWVRTFGSMSGSPRPVGGWGNAVHRSRDAEKLQVGYWGMELGRRLVETYQVPVCLLNGAVGGTRIDQHQRNDADPEDPATIYGRLLGRARRARLTHGVRAVIWHQGENDQGADGPTGGYGWETYRRYFIDLAAAWKQDYPNVRNYYVFQVWPKACAMGVNGSDNRLREVQRTLPTAFSNLSVMSTLGIDPPGGCHFPAAGYAEFARLLAPLIERDHYGQVPPAPVTPPNLRRATFADATRAAVVLEFDQPVTWDDALAGQFTLNGEKGRVASGTATGSTLTLKLTAPAAAGATVTYLDSAAWDRARLLRGANGLAALTFCEVPVLPGRP